MEHVGDYFTDETNTQKYAGHDLVNFRASYPLGDKFKLNFRVMFTRHFHMMIILEVRVSRIVNRELILAVKQGIVNMTVGEIQLA